MRRHIEIERLSEHSIVVRGYARDLITDARPTKILPNWSRQHRGWRTSALFAPDIEALALHRGYAVNVIGQFARQTTAEPIARNPVQAETQASLW